MSTRIKQFNLQRYGALIVLVLMVVLNGFITPNFLAIGTLWNVLIQAFPVILMALGMTMVIATGGIDISVGSTMAISSIILAKLSIHLEWNFGLSLLVALLAAAAFGLFNGVLVGVFNLQPIISTLILMVSGRGIAQLVNDGVVISFYGNRYTDMGVYRIGGVLPVQVVMIAIAVAVVYFVVNRTSFGCYLQAVGDNSKTARLTGVRTSMILICVYLLCALLAGFAASFETLRLCSADPNNIGNNIELDCVAAVAVGGTSMSGGRAHVLGTVVGALVMQLVTTMVNMNNIPYAYSLIVKAAIIVVALYLQHRKD